MANIPSASTYINDIEVASDAPITESLMTEIGGSTNYSLDRDAEFLPIKAKVDAMTNVDVSHTGSGLASHNLYTVPTGKQFTGYVHMSFTSGNISGFSYFAVQSFMGVSQIYCVNTSDEGKLLGASRASLAAYDGSGYDVQKNNEGSGTLHFLIPVNMFSTDNLYLSFNGCTNVTYRLVGTEFKF